MRSAQAQARAQAQGCIITVLQAWFHVVLAQKQGLRLVLYVLCIFHPLILNWTPYYEIFLVKN